MGFIRGPFEEEPEENIEFKADSPEQMAKELLDELERQRDKYADLEAKYRRLVKGIQGLYRNV